MLELGGDADFAEEPVGTEGGGQFGMQHLERDRPIVLEVVGQEDGGHAPAAGLTLDGVGARRVLPGAVALRSGTAVPVWQ